MDRAAASEVLQFLISGIRIRLQNQGRLSHAPSLIPLALGRDDQAGVITSSDREQFDSLQLCVRLFVRLGEPEKKTSMFGGSKDTPPTPIMDQLDQWCPLGIALLDLTPDVIPDVGDLEIENKASQNADGWWTMIAHSETTFQVTAVTSHPASDSRLEPLDAGWELVLRLALRSHKPQIDPVKEVNITSRLLEDDLLLKDKHDAKHIHALVHSSLKKLRELEKSNRTNKADVELQEEARQLRRRLCRQHQFTNLSGEPEWFGALRPFEAILSWLDLVEQADEAEADSKRRVLEAERTKLEKQLAEQRFKPDGINKINELIAKLQENKTASFQVLKDLLETRKKHKQARDALAPLGPAS